MGRKHKIKTLLYNICCCVFLCPKFSQHTGFDKLKPTIDSMLRVTLVHATNISSRLSFYFEIWTEPAEGWPKNTRIHDNVVGQADLGCEQVELDWLGDETELVIQLVTFTGSKQSKDAPLGEVRVLRSALEKYAAEAKGAETDLAKGARIFTVKSLDSRKAFIARSTRFKNNNPVLPMALSMVQEKAGYDLPGFSEVLELRHMNETLQRENIQLRTQAGINPNTASGLHSDTAPSPMSVAIRFEIQPRKKGLNPGGRLFQCESFEVNNGGPASHS